MPMGIRILMPVGIRVAPGPGGSRGVRRRRWVATHPTERTNQKNENENANPRTPAGPQTNAHRDNITPCGSPTPHFNDCNNNFHNIFFSQNCPVFLVQGSPGKPYEPGGTQQIKKNEKLFGKKCSAFKHHNFSLFDRNLFIDFE